MKAKINITYKDKDGNIIIDPTENEVAYSPETKQLYKFTNNEWKMIKPEGGLNLSTYDLNKQIIAQMENIEINEDAMLKAKQTIQAFGYSKGNYYYMLLCRDINYYTLFHNSKDPMVWEDVNCFADEVIDCVHDIGAIKSVEEENGAIEIWVHPVNGEVMAMYLFPYDQGVIECRC